MIMILIHVLVQLLLGGLTQSYYMMMNFLLGIENYEDRMQLDIEF